MEDSDQLASDPAEVVASYLAALADNDLERAAAFLSPHVEAVDVPLGLTLRGREAVVDALAERLRAFPDMSLAITNVAAAEEWVATEHVSVGTHEGSLSTPAGDILATGRTLKTEMAEWFRVQDGVITVSRAYWDLGTAMRQLGIS